MADETSPLLRNGDSEIAAYVGPPTSQVSESNVPGPNLEDDKPKVSLGAIFPALALGVVLVAMDTTIVVSTYASIGSEMKQLQSTSWIATAYMLTLTSFQPLYGKLSDIFGRKACLIFAYSVFGIGSLLCGLARNMTELTIARAIAGMGGGGMSTVGTILLSDVVPLRSRGTWQGIINIVYATGQAVGAPLGGILADSIGWRWAFLIQAPATLVAVTTVALALHIPPKHTSHFVTKLKRIDFGGALTLVLTVFSLLWALDRGNNNPWDDRWIILSFASSLFFFLVFGVVELKLAIEPFFPWRIVINRALLAAFFANFFTTMASMCIVFNIPLYLQAVKGRSASEAGLWMLPSIAGGVSGSLSGGLIIQKTGKYYFLTLSVFVLALVNSIGISLTTGGIVDSLPGMAVCFSFLSFGYGSGITTTLVAMIANAGAEDQAIATAVSYLFRSLGSVLGVSIGSALVQSGLVGALHRRLPGTDIDEIVRKVRESLSYINELDPATQAIVRSSYEEAIHIAWWFSIASGVAVVFCTLFITEKPIPQKK